MGSFIKAPSTLFLIFANLATIIFAVYYQWSFITVLWIYWCQSVTIGFFNFFRILALKDFSTEGFSVNGRQPKPTQATKISTAIFFAVHYGFFHFIYAIFLLAFTLTAAQSLAAEIDFIIGGAILFFITHLVSFLFYLNRQKPKENIGKIMFYPYARIIPMHLTLFLGGIFFGNASIIVMVFFLLLKTAADVLMHFIEHKEQLNEISYSTLAPGSASESGINTE